MPSALGIPASGLSNPAAAIEALNPIGWWRLDDSSGTTAVARVGNDGTYQGSPTLQAGPLAIDGQSAQFNNPTTNDYVTLAAQTADINAAATEFTITAFVEFTSVARADNFIWEEGAATNGVSLCLNNSTLYGLAWSSNTFISRISETGMTTGTLYHIAFGYDSTVPTTVLYINGESVGSVITNSGTSLNFHGAANAIGGVNGQTRNNFVVLDVTNGNAAAKISDVARFGSLLTQDEVRSICRQNRTD